MDVTRLGPKGLAEPIRTVDRKEAEKIEAAVAAKKVILSQPYILDISEEGQNLWENAAREEETNAVQGTQAQMVDLTEEEEEKPVEEQLEDVLKFIEDIRHTFKSKPFKETDDERVEAMEELRQLMEDQEAEYQALEDKAREVAVKTAKTHSMVEKGNRDLVIMLESFRGQEEEQDKETKAGKNKDSASTDEGSGEAMQSFGNRATDRAFAKEIHMDETVERIRGRAYDNFARVRDMGDELIQNLSVSLREMEEAGDSDEKRAGIAGNYLKDAVPIMNTMRDEHDMGLERMKTLRQIRLERRGNQNMVFAARASENIGEQMTENAVDEAFRDNTDRIQHEKIEELKERIRELSGRKNLPQSDELKDLEEINEAGEGLAFSDGKE